MLFTNPNIEQTAEEAKLNRFSHNDIELEIVDPNKQKQIKKELQPSNLILNPTADFEFQNRMNRDIAFLKDEVRQIQKNQFVILERLESIQSHLQDQPLTTMDKSNSCLNNFDNKFPIDNIIDLDTLENNIYGDHQFRINLIKELSYIGGKHTKAMVKRIMAKIFKDDLLQNYSFTGKKGKLSFSSLAICSVIFDKFNFCIKIYFPVFYQNTII